VRYRTADSYEAIVLWRLRRSVARGREENRDAAAGRTQTTRSPNRLRLGAATPVSQRANYSASREEKRNEPPDEGGRPQAKIDADPTTAKTYRNCRVLYRQEWPVRSGRALCQKDWDHRKRFELAAEWPTWSRGVSSRTSPSRGAARENRRRAAQEFASGPQERSTPRELRGCAFCYRLKRDRFPPACAIASSWVFA